MPKYDAPKNGLKDALDAYLSPKNASVFDSTPHSWLRSAAGLLGAGNDDPSIEAMGMVGPTAMAAEGLGPAASRAVKGLKGVYSRLTGAIESRMPEVAHPSKVAAIVKNFAAPEEADMRSLSTLLKAKGNQKVTKQEVLSHLEQNPVELQVRELKGSHSNFQPQGHDFNDLNFNDVGGPGDDIGRAAREPKYSGYQVPGGENYKETLIKIPPKREGSRIHQIVGNYAEDETPSTFMSSHWDDPNVLVHSRSNERTLAPSSPEWGPENLSVGNQVNDDEWVIHKVGEESKGGYSGRGATPEEALKDAAQWLNSSNGYSKLPQGEKGRFIEEIQSDWHQRGRDEGYLPPGESPTGWQEINDPTPPNTGVPDAPFKTTWPDLALKQQLLDTVEDPSLSWMGTSGADTQIRRYPDQDNIRGMSKFYDEVVPNKLRKILAPFGGKVEKGEIPGPPKKFIYRGKGEVGMPPAAPYAPRSPEWDADPVAEVWPRYDLSKAIMDPDYSREIGHQGDDLARTVSKSQTRLSAEPAWIAHLTPEMKEAIMKKGLPLLSLMGLFAPDGDSTPGQSPLSGLKGAQ